MVDLSFGRKSGDPRCTAVYVYPELFGVPLKVPVTGKVLLQALKLFVNNLN